MQHRPIQPQPPLSRRLAEAAALAPSPRRILVSGPDARMRLVLASLLRAEGHQVVHASDAPELLDHVARSLSSPPWHSPVDAVVLDARHDDGDLALLAALREQDWVTPVIVVVSRGNYPAMEEARRLGAALVLPMPLDPDDLRDGLLAVVQPPQ